VRHGADAVLISWPAVSGKSCQIKTTADLRQAWALLPTEPAVLAAITNSMSYAVPIGGAARFFRVVKLDTEPPAVERFSPADGAIAVGRQEPIAV
jgi:hypothetical protein